MSARNSRGGRRAAPIAARSDSLPQAAAHAQGRPPAQGGAAPAGARGTRVTQALVDADHAGQRVDNFLLRLLPGVPRSHVYSLLRSGQVRVDGGRVKPARRLVEGETVRVPPVRRAGRGAAALHVPDALSARLRDAVIHEDAHYLALSKPVGLAVHGGSGLPFGVIEILRAERSRAAGDAAFLELAHRLDRDTSGVLLLAKSRPALLRAQAAFREGLAVKRYFALLCGRLEAAREVDAALVSNRLAGGERLVVPDEGGRPARTRFVPQERHGGATLCEVSIFSGRTHQIRVHAQALGCPVAGDRKYGGRGAAGALDARLRAAGLKRMFLHAHYLELPATAAFPRLLLSAPLPAELRGFLERLALRPS